MRLTEDGYQGKKQDSVKEIWTQYQHNISQLVCSLGTVIIAKTIKVVIQMWNSVRIQQVIQVLEYIRLLYLHSHVH